MRAKFYVNWTMSVIYFYVLWFVTWFTQRSCTYMQDLTSNSSRKMLSDTSGTTPAGYLSHYNQPIPDVKPLIPPLPMSLCFPWTHVSLSKRSAGTVFFRDFTVWYGNKGVKKGDLTRSSNKHVIFCVWSMCTVYVKGAIILHWLFY